MIMYYFDARYKRRFFGIFDDLQFHLTHHVVYHRASTPNDEFSGSLICNSSRTFVTDDCSNRTLRDADDYDGVIACTYVVVGSLNGSNDFYSVYAGGGINYSQSATFSYSVSRYGNHYTIKSEKN